jgi:2'-5' RNA ligase
VNAAAADRGGASHRGGAAHHGGAAHRGGAAHHGGAADRAGEGTARLFTALELPEPVLAALDAWGNAELGSVAGLRRVSPAALHVTLCFLGSRPAGEIEAIAQACSVLSGQGKVQLRLGMPLWLPRRRPRVLAVSVEDGGGDRTLARGSGHRTPARGPGAGLGHLQAILAAALQRGGWYEPEARPFLAHVTVARFGRAGGRELDLTDPPPLSFPGTSVALLRSWPERGGSRYERLAEVSLTDR